jgi:hypothetical protein
VLFPDLGHVKKFAAHIGLMSSSTLGDLYLGQTQVKLL